MPFDSELAGNGFVELHKIMTGAVDWFGGNQDKWRQNGDFYLSASNEPLAACLHGAMVIAAGLHHKIDYARTMLEKYDFYLREATGVTIRDVMKYNDHSSNFNEVMEWFGYLIRKVEMAIATNMNPALADYQSDQMITARMVSEKNNKAPGTWHLLGTQKSTLPAAWSYDHLLINNNSLLPA